MAKVNNPSWGLIILLMFTWIQGFKMELEEVRRISFDYDQCNRKTNIDVTKTKFEVNTISQSTVLYRTTSCTLTFITKNGDICMDIEKISIDDCFVKLNIFTDMASSEPKEVFSCTPPPTDFICSQKKVMKIELIRKNLDVSNYDFKLIVMRKDGPMKTIIITVFVIVIIGIAIGVAICYCSKSFCQKRSPTNATYTQQPNTCVMPSAPPPETYDPVVLDIPKEDPPPYSE